MTININRNLIAKIATKAFATATSIGIGVGIAKTLVDAADNKGEITFKATAKNVIKCAGIPVIGLLGATACSIGFKIADEKLAEKVVQDIDYKKVTEEIIKSIPEPTCKPDNTVDILCGKFISDGTGNGAGLLALGDADGNFIKAVRCVPTDEVVKDLSDPNLSIVAVSEWKSF